MSLVCVCVCGDIEAKAVIKKQESEVTCVQSIVREGEEAVARLRGELEEVEEREETSQRQLAHAIAQVSRESWGEREREWAGELCL